MKTKYGRFSDDYRGSGYMVSFGLKRGWLLFGFRPLNWHFYFTKLSCRPAFRVYAGPFEIEFFLMVKP
ncbi:hypothetical protein [Pseudomonas yamanorum]|uniref:Uncharacterized protein n=1 Tax=Pseudomonas yamanorum TaxID=515393 RepID=A0AAJ3H6A0_9PSED|nr:hypothetical protein [Pseudomonas yamanorum]NWD44192.1 hypothetical protein [Pseudomonas yamanorum]